MKIAMMTEGTYPHGFGGVSVWCDQLIRGMPGYDFQLVAIVATGAEQAVWTLPANVTSMVRVTLWGPAPRGAIRGGLPVRLLRGLVDTLLDSSPMAQPNFADVLRDLFEYAQRGDLGADLISDKAIKVLSGAWRDRWQGSPQSAPSLHDAVTAMQLLAHCLRPLSYPSAQADVGHAVTNGLGVLPALAAKWQYGMPMLVTEHGVYLREQYLRNSKSPYRWPVKSFHLAFMRRLCMLGYSEAETITPGNVYNRRWEERLGAEPGRIRTVYNGVDPANFPAIVGEPADPTISWVGRIDPIKDLETLLRAFCVVRREMPGAKLRLFGAPPHGRDSYLQRCRALAAELGVAESATFEGRIDDIRDAYGAGSIVALSSVSEGFPYSLIEAMTCGRTCVATDVGGVAEAVGETGLVVPPRDPERMAQACLTLLRNNDLRHRLGAAARARALENFTLDAAISTFDEIYSFLGSGRPLPTVPAAAAAQPAQIQPQLEQAVLVGAGQHRAGQVGSGRHGASQNGASQHGTSQHGASQNGTSQHGPSQNGAGQNGAGQHRTGRHGVGLHGVDELCQQFALVCESAVDPLEISSALEFEGLSDQAAQDRYGARDVFALADEMYRRVPRRPAEPEQPADPWQISKVRSALHGLLYGLPTACFPAATGLLTGPGVLSVLIVALLASWAISQTLAYLGHARLGQAEPGQAARLLRGGTAGGTAGVVLATAVAAIAVHARVTALVFGVGLGTYMVGATVLMVLGAERLLLAVLAPAVLGAASFLIAGRPPPLEHAVWGALAITPLLALGLAATRAWQLRTVRQRAVRSGRIRTAPRAAQRRVRPGRRRAAGVPLRRVRSRRRPGRAARLAAAGAEHGRGRVDAGLVQAPHPADAADHARAHGLRRPGQAGAGRGAGPVPVGRRPADRRGRGDRHRDRSYPAALVRPPADRHVPGARGGDVRGLAAAGVRRSRAAADHVRGSAGP